MAEFWDYILRIGETGKPIEIASLDLDPDTDLQGATAKLVVRHRETREVKEFDADTLTEVEGEAVVTYAWQEGDLDTRGYWDAYVDVTMQGGNVFSFPLPNPFVILVEGKFSV